MFFSCPFVAGAGDDPSSPSADFAEPRRHAHMPGVRGRVVAVVGLVALALAGGLATTAQGAGTRSVAIAQARVRAVAANALPVGNFETLTSGVSAVTAKGWALDPDTTSPITVSISVDGAAGSYVANLVRPDLASHYTSAAHGFKVTIPAAPGAHQVCVTAINTPVGINAVLRCRTVTVANALPVGNFETLTSTATGIIAKGWALDSDTTSPITVSIAVDGASQIAVANLVRPDLATYYTSTAHGFKVTVPSATGDHRVCVSAINTPVGVNRSLGCRTVTVLNALPVGALQTLTASTTGVTVVGWAQDPNTTEPIGVNVAVDGGSQAAVANLVRPDLPAGSRPNGYAVTVPAGPGSHEVCVSAINFPVGINPVLGCRTITVATSTRGVGLEGMNEWMSASEIQSDLAMSQQLGITWERIEAPWYAIQEDGPSSYHWSLLDNLVTQAQQHGQQVLLEVVQTPVWARPAGAPTDDSGSWYAPARMQDLGAFVGALVARYGPKGVTAYEIWNEPNTALFWHDTPASPMPKPTRYAEMLKAAYTAAHTADPGVTVISAGLSPDLASGDGTVLDPRDFLTALYAAGAGNSFDAFGFHPYTFPALPSLDDPGNGWRMLTDLRGILVQNKDANKLIWATEVGAPTGGSVGVSEAMQAQILTVVAQDYLATPWLGPIFTYCRRDYLGSSADSENFFGLLRLDGSAKPAFAVVQAFTAAVRSQAS